MRTNLLSLLLLASCSCGDTEGSTTSDASSDAGCVARCDGSSLITCEAAGESAPALCALGCSTVGGAHCQAIVPSNGASVSDLENVTGALVVARGQSITLNTDTGEIRLGSASVLRAAGVGVIGGIGFRAASQGANAPEVAIFSVAAITVEGWNNVVDEGELHFIGARSVVILSAGAVLLEGVVDASAQGGGEGRGPGGGAGGGADIDPFADARGCAPGLSGSFVLTQHTGGGGGGNGTLGGSGGASGPTPGGASATDLGACSGPDVSPLRGGSGGGRGAADPAQVAVAPPAVGGGGGGALQITSLVSITVGGIAELDAGGGGGGGQYDDRGGGGGGAGGAILLEAPTVTISGGFITANGGGGGSGRENARGQSARRFAVRASGGEGSGGAGNTGRGGFGSIGEAAGQEATVGAGETTGTGGGGGGAGVIRLSSISAPAISGVLVISPPHTIGTLPLE